MPSAQIIGLIAQLVGALHQYHRVIGFNPVQTWIFSRLYHNYFNDIKISTPQFQYMNNKQKYAAEYF